MGTPRVLLVQVLILAFLRTWASTLPMLTQLVPSNTKRTGNTAFLECQVNVTQFENVYIHWYRQQPGGPLIRILYLSSNENVIHEEGVNEERYEAKKRERDFSASLRIHQVTEADEGLYYCACWDSSGVIKSFAEGSQLIVLRSESVIPKKPPKSIIFLPTFEEVKQKKSGTYICLLEDFFPNVIKSYWKENKYSQPLDAQFGPITGNGSSYSQVSWLTVPEDSLSKNFTYFYQHENTGIEPQEIPIASVWKDFKNSSSETCKDKDWTKGLQELHFANISAFYTYTILLVKSTIYFTIVLFFLYQKKVVKMLGSQRSK
ncbi:T-cell receptor gamma alternate reading frame protein isoform 1-T1 [Sarcophilus harrisii]